MYTHSKKNCSYLQHCQCPWRYVILVAGMVSVVPGGAHQQQNEQNSPLKTQIPIANASNVLPPDLQDCAEKLGCQAESYQHHLQWKYGHHSCCQFQLGAMGTKDNNIPSRQPFSHETSCRLSNAPVIQNHCTPTVHQQHSHQKTFSTKDQKQLWAGDGWPNVHKAKGTITNRYMYMYSMFIFHIAIHTLFIFTLPSTRSTALLGYFQRIC